MHYIEAKTILSSQNGMNLYRGCQHGCIYCDSRSRCYGMEHNFEDIAVKKNALILLEDSLRRKRKSCMIGTGSMSDPYMPIERTLRYTRAALELIYKYGFGATLITKSDAVLDDLELLRRINENTKCVVQITLTTADDELCRIIEPAVCPTSRRFDALMKLKEAGIPTVVWLCPILPFINDTVENIESILDMCSQAGVWGVINFGMGLTLRDGNREYFYAKLDRHFPGLKSRYIGSYGLAYELPSPNEKALTTYFHRRCEELGIVHDNDRIFAYLNEFERKSNTQISLFE